MKKIALGLIFMLSSLFVSISYANSCMPSYQGVPFFAATMAINIGGCAVSCHYSGGSYYGSPNAKPILPGKWTGGAGCFWSCRSANPGDCQFQPLSSETESK